MKRKIIMAVFFLFVLAMPIIASASIVTYQGMDNAAAITGPFTNSDAAQAAFLLNAGLLGTLNTITFENQSLGFSANFTAASGVTVGLNVSTNYGDGFSGISTTSYGNLYGFNTTSGGSKWLGFAGGTATFSFANPTQSFGMYLTGLQTYFTSSLTVNFNDGTAQSLSVPITTDGGVVYFGFTDAGANITSISITNLSNDAWGIDNITYSSSVPVPAAVWLLGSGLLGLFGVRRKIRN